MDRGTGELEDVDTETLTTRGRWPAEPLRHAVATGDGWAGIRADGALMAVHAWGPDRVAEETVLDPGAIRALGLGAVLHLRPIQQSGLPGVDGWALAGTRLDGAPGLLAV